MNFSTPFVFALLLSATAAPAQPAPAGLGAGQTAAAPAGPLPVTGQPAPPLPVPPPGSPQAAPPLQTPPRIPPQPPAAPPVPVSRFGRFDLDVSLSALARSPELKACAGAFASAQGHADCPVPPADDKLSRVQVAWEDSKPGGELIALRLLFDPALAPPLTDLEWQLTRGWGPPVLEQLRREGNQKVFTLQWEDPEHRTTLEAGGALGQGSRVTALVIERKPRPPGGDLSSLRPRPFPGLRVRFARRLDWDGQPHAVVWGTSLTPAQEALGEAGQAWSQQRGYVGIFRLDPATEKRPRRWRALWERTSGEDEDDPQRILRVETRDITSDGAPDIEIELSCASCGNTASELLVKTVRAGKLVDLLSRNNLYRANVELLQGTVRIREPEGEDSLTVTTYSYDRGKGAFVLAREERVAGPHP
ncbi:MAG TPA: hypothetical protein VN883_06265 [Myxococcales bacterium]|jgi:hypothetical protein|nr:hypothetical protein [Myxococcales bacterium]